MQFLKVNIHNIYGLNNSLKVETFHRSDTFHFAVSAISFERRNIGKKLVDTRINLIDMRLIQSLKNDFSFHLPLFSKYPATSINRYFYKMNLT